MLDCIRPAPAISVDQSKIEKAQRKPLLGHAHRGGATPHAERRPNDLLFGIGGASRVGSRSSDIVSAVRPAAARRPTRCTHSRNNGARRLPADLIDWI
jgi:hypothetical protein